MDDSKSGKAKKYLVIPNGKIEPDVYFSMYSLVTALKEKGGDVEIASEKALPEKYASSLPMEGVKIVNKLEQQKYLIQFPGQKTNVKGIQWSQNQDSLNLYVNMQDGQFNEKNMKFQAMGGEYEQVFLIGVKTLEEIGAINKPENEYIFKSSKVVSIGGEIKDKQKLPDLKIESDEKTISVTEDTYNYIKNNGLNLNRMRAASLLAGIFYATDSFKENIKDAKTFLICADLMRIGATNTQAQELLDKSKEQKPSKKNGRTD